MAEDRIRYDLKAQNALRQVIREVLADVERDGLPGEHHFYITFDTNAPGVSLSPRLKERHKDEMTIVLQHQFWDLEVLPDRFEVALSFANMPERLVVPFDAIKGFFDPSVQFGLQFDSQHAPAPAAAEEAAPEGRQAEEETPAPEEPPAASEEPARAQSVAGGGAEVVSLDSFRKKS